MYYVFITHRNKIPDNNIIESWKQKNGSIFLQGSSVYEVV